MLARNSKFCIAGVVSELYSRNLIDDIVSEVKASARKFPNEFLGVYRDPELLREAVAACNVVLLIVGSGGTEGIIYKGLRHYRGSLLLLSYNAHNSLAAAVEVLPALRDAGVRVTLYNHRLGYERKGLKDYLRVASALARFYSSKIGLLGGPAPWLVYSGMTAEEAARFGPRIAEIPLKRLYEYYMEVGDEEAHELAEMYRGRTSSLISDKGLLNVMKLHLAVKRIVEEEELDAFTIDCFEVTRVLGVTPCFTLAYHNSIGVIAGCEGDLSSLLAMMIASYISGGPPFMGNLGDATQDTIVVSHCTAPLNLGLYYFTTHFETGRPLGVSVTPPAGRVVTILKLDHRRKQVLVGRGTIVSSSPRPNLCRTQVVVRVPFDPEILLEESRGNHYTLVLGDHVWKVSVAARLLGLDVVDLTRITG